MPSQILVFCALIARSMRWCEAVIYIFNNVVGEFATLIGALLSGLSLFARLWHERAEDLFSDRGGLDYHHDL